MNKLVQQRQEQMEHSSLSVKEEKAALQEMKKMKEDAKVRTAIATCWRPMMAAARARRMWQRSSRPLLSLS